MKKLVGDSEFFDQDKLSLQLKSKALTLFLCEIKHQSIEEGMELNARMFDFMTALPANTDLAAAYKAETGFELKVRDGYSNLTSDRLIQEIKDYCHACASIYDFEFDLTTAASHF